MAVKNLKKRSGFVIYLYLNDREFAPVKKAVRSLNKVCKKGTI